MPDSKFEGASPNAHLLIGEMPAPAQFQSRWDVLTGGSTAPILALLAAVFLATRMAAPMQATVTPQNERFDLIFLQQPGPGGGGGGGGNNRPEPPRKAELPGKEKITVPVTKPPEIKPVEKPKETPPPAQEVKAPVQEVASGVQQLPGVLASMPSAPGDTSSLGLGSGTGAGGGNGSGVGKGNGAGIGDGSGMGTGGGVYQVGNGVTSPVPIYEPRPNYTADAMRAKVQGLVVMDAVVMPDGSVTQVKITRSLDPTFGLDQEAVKTVRSWRFKPGMYRGQPVPVLVSIELSFTLR